MWTDGPVLRVVLALLLLLAPMGGAAEEGQYRSRILVTPPGEIGRGADADIGQLEQQIKGIDDPYARSGAGRHLGRHFAREGDLDKAVAYYREALAAGGLSDIANREMLRELAAVYLQAADYDAATQAMEQALELGLAPATLDFLVLARAHYESGHYARAVAALDRMRAAGLQLDAGESAQAVALYYRSGAYAQAEAVLRHLLQLQPGESRHWHLLANVYLKQGKRRQALDQLVLARERGVPFTAAELVLLADLHAVSGDPYGGAIVLQDGLATGAIEGSAGNYRKLFQYWFRARENERAAAALAQAAALSGDTELYLYLAQLQQEEEAWQRMRDTLYQACAKPLPDKYVGRANLLLGISQLKLGDGDAARRSFINATLVGGAVAQAGQWLEYMEAAPPTEDELRRLVGICHGVDDKGLAAPAAVNSAAESTTEVARKSLPATHVFYSEQQQPLAQAMPELRAKLTRMGVALVKAGGAVRGDPHILFSAGAGQGGELSRWQLALPTDGSTRPAGRFRIRQLEAVDCFYTRFEGAPAAFAAALGDFLVRVRDSGEPLSGEARIVLLPGSSADTLRVELQVELGAATPP